LYLVAGTTIGARLGHCLFYAPGYYLARPLEILKIWEGGLASHGGTAGVIIALWMFSRKNPEFTFMWLLDRVSVPVALVACFIRFGNLMNSEILGRPTDLPWAVIFEKVDQLPRHPAQVYESLTYLALFIVTMTIYRKSKTPPAPGLLFGISMVWIFGSRIGWEFLKENQEAFEAGMLLNMGQLLSIPFVILGIYLMKRARSQSPA
jgi:prolipoprotein diacylglyceryl transferase